MDYITKYDGPLKPKFHSTISIDHVQLKNDQGVSQFGGEFMYM